FERFVVDPVMVAASGSRLLREDAVETLKWKLLPLALVVTPNIPEAQVLIGAEIKTLDEMKDAAREIARLGPRNVIVKGGHRQAEKAIDVLFDGKRFTEYSAEFVKTNSTHGTGCTFSSAITSGLAKGLTVPKAVAVAKSYVTEALRTAYPIGAGHGPLNHMYELWRKLETGAGGE
ncbi:MAG: hydroxymethylpyrimidine/phosphomethylpyrimidine kinase, partial [Chloroflexi bacterium]|nr:hydroxymethylpyrimidine/phosphomethylpyrimidine kinase [Chloroflexota bacterium]